MTIYTPYTYLIGWSKLDKWYYGVRTAHHYKCIYESGAHPNDLWKTYFTSSPSVEKFIEENGDPDIIQIRKTFRTRDEALLWESNVLKRIRVKQNDKWLNKHDSCNKNFGGCPRGHKFGKGKKCYHNPQTLEKRYFWPDDKIPDGFVRGETPKKKEHLEKIKASKKQRGYSKEALENIKRSARLRKNRGDFSGNNNSNARPIEIDGVKYGSRKEAMEQLNKSKSHILYYLKHGSFPKNKTKCERCGVVCTNGNYVRWHGDKCRHQYSL